MPELMAVAGVDATPLPAEIQHRIVFCAALLPQVPDAGNALIAFLSSPAAVSVIKSKGLAPM